MEADARLLQVLWASDREGEAPLCRGEVGAYQPGYARMPGKGEGREDVLLQQRGGGKMREVIRCDWCAKKTLRREAKKVVIGSSRYLFCSLKCEMEYKDKVLGSYK
jgi:hypothetical protein